MHPRETSFGQQLRQLRLRAGLTQEALAERAGLATKAIAALESGARRSPYPRTLSMLAGALELSAVEGAAFARMGRSTRAGGQASLPTDDQSGAQASRLPVWLTSFVGREAEVSATRTLLDPSGPAVRLLTLVGPGGVGKTRLAVAIAAEVAPVYADGAVFVDLAPLRDARLVPATIARALDLRESSGGRSARELLLEHLQARQLLLLLDNFEHLLGAAPLVAELLQRCPHVAVLLTSRTALRVQGEHRFAVAPLPTPSAEADPAEQDLSAWPSIQLFVERAQAVANEFALTRSNAPAVAGVCRRLDGVPLAIELAAARVPLLSPAALLRRLELRLPMLTGGAADLPDRQQTLRSTLTWSFDLLEPADQVLFRRLAVFAGGWTLEAAEAVCVDAALPPHQLLDRLQVLVDSSLVRRLEDMDGEPRYGMLETIREYAGECLEASAEAVQARARHRDWSLSLAESVPTDLAGPEEAAWHRRLDVEAPNLESALGWVQYPPTDAAPVLRLATALSRLRRAQGRLPEACHYLETALRHGTEPSAIRALALARLGHLVLLQGDLARAEHLGTEAVLMARTAGEAGTLAYCLRLLGIALAQRERSAQQGRAMLEEALAVSRAAGDQLRIASALMQLGSVVAPDDLATGRQLLDEAIELANKAGDRQATALALGHRAAVALAEGSLAAACSLAEEASAASQAIGFVDGLVMALWIRGAAARLQGDYPTAYEQYQTALHLAWEEGHIPSVCTILDHYAGLEAELGEAEQAALLVGALDAACTARGMAIFRVWTLWWATEPAATRARVRAGEPALVAAWQTGRALSLAQTIELVEAGAGHQVHALEPQSKPPARAFSGLPIES